MASKIQLHIIHTTKNIEGKKGAGKKAYISHILKLDSLDLHIVNYI